MNSAIIRKSNIQSSELNSNSSVPASKAARRGGLVAQWIIVDNKLVCKWLIED